MTCNLLHVTDYKKLTVIRYVTSKKNCNQLKDTFEKLDDYF
jgi:hypothetical protein